MEYVDALDSLKTLKESTHSFKVYFSGDSVTPSWRNDLIEDLETTLQPYSVFLMNLKPRAVDYKESIRDNHFKSKFKWELEAAQAADLIYFHFSEDSPCPHTLLEFGLYVPTKPVIITCEPSFWKRGYVEILTAYYNKKFTTSAVESWEDLANACAQRARK